MYVCVCVCETKGNRLCKCVCVCVCVCERERDRKTDCMYVCVSVCVCMQCATCFCITTISIQLSRQNRPNDLQRQRDAMTVEKPLRLLSNLHATLKVCSKLHKHLWPQSCPVFVGGEDMCVCVCVCVSTFYSSVHWYPISLPHTKHFFTENWFFCGSDLFYGVLNTCCHDVAMVTECHT